MSSNRKKKEIPIIFESSSDEDESDSESEILSDEKNDIEFSDPEPHFGLKIAKPYHLLPHQIEAINWMKKVQSTPNSLGMKGGVLAAIQGLGKTLMATSLCMSEMNFNEMTNKLEILKPIHPKEVVNIISKYVNYHKYPNLVICSKTVAYSWKTEIPKFYGETCPILYFHKSEIGKKFDTLEFDDIKNYKMIITTYETVMNIAKKNKVYDRQFQTDQFNRRAGIKNSRRPLHSDCINARGGMLLFKTPWNMIILDESHRISNPTSSTFYSVMALWGDKKWNLSGTPIRNYSSDLYSQFRFCGYDKQIISSQFNYNEYIKNNMMDFILFKSYEGAGIVLPPINRTIVTIELTDREKEIYDYYHSSMKQIYNGFIVGSYSFSNVLTLFLRLRQLCVSPYTILAESSRKYKGIEDEEYTLSQQILDKMTDGLTSWVQNKNGTSGIQSAKMKALINILKNVRPGSKTLVFTSFKKVIDICTLAMDTYMPDTEYSVLDGDVTGKARDDTLDNFRNNSDISVMFVSYKVGSEGLTLIEAENVIHAENWWSPAVQEQAERRIYRIGQTKPVNIYSIIIKNSIEERINDICAEKTKMIEEFKSARKISASRLDAAMIGRIIR